MIDADGNKIYHYLAIKEQDVENFRNAIRAGKPYDVRDYGAVLESGFDQPDDKVKEKMTKLYGCNHNSVVTIG